MGGDNGGEQKEVFRPEERKEAKFMLSKNDLVVVGTQPFLKQECRRGFLQAVYVGHAVRATITPVVPDLGVILM